MNIIYNLHRPQRSSVIRSRHDLQKVCWQGNCNGSRKISRQIGLKKIRSIKNRFKLFLLFTM
jgi:hypothetical protein